MGLQDIDSPINEKELTETCLLSGKEIKFSLEAKVEFDYSFYQQEEFGKPVLLSKNLLVATDKGYTLKGTTDIIKSSIQEIQYISELQGRVLVAGKHQIVLDGRNIISASSEILHIWNDNNEIIFATELKVSINEIRDGSVLDTVVLGSKEKILHINQFEIKNEYYLLICTTAKVMIMSKSPLKKIFAYETGQSCVTAYSVLVGSTIFVSLDNQLFQLNQEENVFDVLEMNWSVKVSFMGAYSDNLLVILTNTEKLWLYNLVSKTFQYFFDLCPHQILFQHSSSNDSLRYDRSISVLPQRLKFLCHSYILSVSLRDIEEVLEKKGSISKYLYVDFLLSVYKQKTQDFYLATEKNLQDIAQRELGDIFYLWKLDKEQDLLLKFIMFAYLTLDKDLFFTQIWSECSINRYTFLQEYFLNREVDIPPLILRELLEHATDFPSIVYKAKPESLDIDFVIRKAKKENVPSVIFYIYNMMNDFVTPLEIFFNQEMRDYIIFVYIKCILLGKSFPFLKASITGRDELFTFLVEEPEYLVRLIDLDAEEFFKVFEQVFLESSLNGEVVHTKNHSLIGRQQIVDILLKCLIDASPLSKFHFYKFLTNTVFEYPVFLHLPTDVWQFVCSELMHIRTYHRIAQDCVLKILTNCELDLDRILENAEGLRRVQAYCFEKKQDYISLFTSYVNDSVLRSHAFEKFRELYRRSQSLDWKQAFLNNIDQLIDLSPKSVCELILDYFIGDISQIFLESITNGKSRFNVIHELLQFTQGIQYIENSIQLEYLNLCFLYKPEEVESLLCVMDGYSVEEMIEKCEKIGLQSASIVLYKRVQAHRKVVETLKLLKRENEAFMYLNSTQMKNSLKLELMSLLDYPRAVKYVLENSSHLTMQLKEPKACVQEIFSDLRLQSNNILIYTNMIRKRQMESISEFQYLSQLPICNSICLECGNEIDFGVSFGCGHSCHFWCNKGACKCKESSEIEYIPLYF